MLKLPDIKQYLNKQSIIALAPKKNQRAAAVGLLALFLATYYGYYAVDAYRHARQLAGLVPVYSASGYLSGSVRHPLPDRGHESFRSIRGIRGRVGQRYPLAFQYGH